MKNKKTSIGIGFKEIEESIVILRHGFTYKQCKAFERCGYIYAKVGGGFVKLRSDGGSSNPSISWEDIEGCGVSGKIHTARYLRIDQ